MHGDPPFRNSHLCPAAVVRASPRHARTLARPPAQQLSNVFEAKVINVLEKSIMFELTAHPQEIERFIELLSPCAPRPLPTLSTVRPSSVGPCTVQRQAS